MEANLRLKPELAGPFRQLQETARKIAKVSQESKIAIDVEEYVQKFSPHMMEVTYSWCKVLLGSTFHSKIKGIKILRSVPHDRYF